MAKDPEKLAAKKALWAERWEIARAAAKTTTSEELEAIADQYGVAVNSVRNYRGVARAFPARDVRGLVGKVPFTVFEILRGREDALDLIRGGITVAEARKLGK
jgi:hypothetical protein